MSNNHIDQSVKDYIDRQSDKGQEQLLIIRNLIYKAVPEAKELINYEIPAYALIEGGKRETQIMMAGFKNHIGLYPHPTTIKQFEKELKGYKVGKGSVQFPLNQPLPEDLIFEMIKYRKKVIDDGAVK